MAQFLHLTEARIRDFNRRKEAGETSPAPEKSDGRGGGSLESILFDEIVELRQQLRDTEDKKAAKELKLKISALETQLLVSLESTGRPLLAQIMAERLREVDRREKHKTKML